MSKFENYDDVSKSYDQGREPVGADVIVGMLHVYGGKPLKVSYLNGCKTLVFYCKTLYCKF